MNKTTDSFLTIAGLWQLCMARWRWLVASVLFCLLLALNYLVTTPFLYTRKAVVMVREETLGKSTNENNGSEFNDMGFVKQNSNVINVIRHYTSLDVLIEVAHQLDSTLEGGYLVNKAMAIQSRLSADNADPRSTIIDLTYRDRSTAEAERVLNAILQAYDERWLADKRQQTLNTSHFIDSRLKLLQQDLNIVDDSIALFKSRYGITDLEHVSDLYLQQQSSSDSEILRLTNQKAMAEYIRSLLDDKSSEHQLLLVNSGLSNSVLETQISLYNSLLMQLQSHLNYTSSQNPLILNQEKEIESLRSKIRENLRSHIHTIDIQLQSLIDYYDEATSKVVSNPAQAKHLATIERERKVKESLYMYLLQKKEENEISITYKSSNILVIEPPHGSGKPTSPKRSVVILSAFLLGLLIPVTVIFLRASFDDSVRDRHDVERNCDIPFLGEVPYSGRDQILDRLLVHLGIKSKVMTKGVVVNQNVLNASNEAFRVLRNNMDASFAGKFLNEGSRAYLIKSTQIEVGKTFVAMNLALIRAIGGERVLFIDGDLRQASASRLWNAPLSGLTNFLNGEESDFRKLLFQPEGYPMLDVLPTGALPTNPTELLLSPLLDQLLLAAKEHYDCIIIDSPTSGMLADADIIERVVDCTMFVIRAGRFKRNQLNEISPIQATNSDSKLQYIILNGVSIDDRYGYSYLHKYERSESDTKVVEDSKKASLLNKMIFRKKN